VSASFKDHFSKQAATYAAYRPTYPPELFAWLAELVRQRTLAWDVGTGSGQAAVGLAGHFERVVATDASAAQLQHAAAHPRIEYRVAQADASGLAAESVDLVTVAQALHWFDIGRFFSEARRVLAPGGVLAVWCYGDPVLEDSVLDQILRSYNRGTVEQYWPPERDLVLEEYRSIRFPFDQVDSPHFALQARWSLRELVGYLRSWSATSQYLKRHGSDPVVAVETEMRRAWGPDQTKYLIRWPVTLRVGRI
jgi:ubiquinone/menaquinone biosynthesis C-methylase UbiE